MQCRSCGGTISENAKVCGHCGVRVEVASGVASTPRRRVISIRTVAAVAVGLVVVAGLIVGGLALFGSEEAAEDRAVASTTVPTTAATTVPVVSISTGAGLPDPAGTWASTDSDGSFMFLFLTRRAGTQVFDVVFYDDGVSGCSSTGFRYPGTLTSFGVMQPDGALQVDEASFECFGGDVVPAGFAMDLHYDADADVLDDAYGTEWERSDFWVGVHPWSFFDLCDLGERGTLACTAVPPSQGLYGYADFPEMADAGAEREHAYGQGPVSFIYGFYLPVEVDGTVRLSAVLSSEFDWYEAPADGFSDVELGVNAVAIDTIRVRPDDGMGEWYSWEFDASLLEQGTNSFYFAVRADAEYPNGLSIYGPSIVDGVDDGFIVIEFDV